MAFPKTFGPFRMWALVRDDGSIVGVADDRMKPSFPWMKCVPVIVKSAPPKKRAATKRRRR